MNLGRAVIAAVFVTLIFLTAVLFWAAAAKHHRSRQEWHLFSDSGKSPFSDGPTRTARDVVDAPAVVDQKNAERALMRAFPGDAPQRPPASPPKGTKNGSTTAVAPHGA